MRLATALLAFGLFAAAAPATALDLGALTDAERDAFRAEVRAYLLDNPEVLMEAIGVLDARDQAAQIGADKELVAANRASLTNDPQSWVGGNVSGDVTVIEFMDYRCGYCRQAFQEVEDLVSTDGNIRFILKEFPILGEQSVLASQFAIATRQLHGDDAYKGVHDALMTLRGDVTEVSLTRLAEGFGFDPAPIMAKMASPEVMAVIAANHDLADRLRITGTPTFIFEDQMLRGYVPLDSMMRLVDGIRAEG